MENKITLFILLVYISSFNIYSYEIENAESVDISVNFQKISHQNPWIVGEPFSKKGKAIHLGNGKFFTMSLSAQKPLFAEMDSYDYAVPKLKIEAYDSETGFTLLQAVDTDRYPKAVLFDINSVRKNCKSGKSKYIQLPFSKTPIKAFILEKKESDESNFSFNKSVVCGITFQDVLIPTEYIRTFLNTNGYDRQFPHPGWMYDVQLTPSEKKFYSRDIGRGILVSDTFPGIGPAYSLYPGDVVFGINGTLLQKINDWDRYDRIMDLILRDASGKLKPIGSQVKLFVYRNHQKLEITYRLNGYKTDGFLIPEQAPNRMPLYLILGGFFFTELTGSYIKEFGSEYRLKSEKNWCI
ncbi:MAG: PDZ domain-containing protein [Leptospira sp.]|nr:PDZ domain-containing protein [Leptospira sp.]